MTKKIRLSPDFITIANAHASATHRTLSEQIEHWVKVGRMAEDNSDLPFSFIKDVMLAEAQIKEGQVTHYVRCTK